jgi:O-antigen ligase
VIFPRVTAGAVDGPGAGRIGRAVVVVTAVLAAAVAVAAPVVIPSVYGAPYRGSVAVVWCALPGLVLFSAGRTSQAYLAATDKLRPIMVATLAGVVAGGASLVPLTSSFGAAGAGAADSIGYLAFTVVLLGGRRHGCYLPNGVRVGAAWLTRAAWLLAQGSLARTGARLAAFACAAAAAGVAAAEVSTRSTATLGAVAAILVVLTGLVVPNTGLYLLATALPVSQTTFGAALVTGKAVDVLLGVLVVGQLVNGRLVRPRPLGAGLAFALVGYVMISATLAEGTSGVSHAWRYVLMLGLPLLCLPVILHADAAGHRVLTVFSFTAAAVAVAEIVKSHGSLVAAGSVSAANGALLAAGQTGAVNHNTEAALFVLALGVLLARFPRTRNAAARAAFAAALFALAVGIAYSFSRSAYFGAIAVVAVFALRHSIRGLVGVAAGACCLLPLMPAAAMARVASIWSSGGLDADSAIRLDLWASALRMFSNHPMLGVGYLNFSSQLPAYFRNTASYDTFLVQFSMLDFAHNTYLTVLAETGLVGAVPAAGLFILGWRKGWLAARNGDWAGEAALLGFIGIGVCSAFGEVLLVLPVLAAFVMVTMVARAGAQAPGAGGVLHG